MDYWVLVLTAVLAFICVYFIFFDGRLRFGGRSNRTQTSTGNRRRAGGAAARRQQQQESTSERRPIRQTDADMGNENSSTNELSDDDNEENKAQKEKKKKLGTKKAFKLAEKEKRKEEREAEEKYRENLRKLEDEEIKKRKKQEEEASAAEASLLAAEKKRQEEEEAREQAEYERLKATFSIEGEGLGVKMLDATAEEKFNIDFVEAIKKTKIISLERLCIEFEIKTDTCIDKIRTLTARHLLSGVLDDRGKFIYIEPSEYESIAKFIELRGRITMRELMEQSNKVIKARTPAN